MSVTIVDFDSSIIQYQIANNLSEHRSREGTYADDVQTSACRVGVCSRSRCLSVRV